MLILELEQRKQAEQRRITEEEADVERIIKLFSEDL